MGAFSAFRQGGLLAVKASQRLSGEVWRGMDASPHHGDKRACQ